jgi:hypothetical protein
MTELLNSLPSGGRRCYMYWDKPINTRATHTTYTVTTNMRSQTDSFNVGRGIDIR